MKRQKLGYVKTIDPKERSVTAYVSTFEWDRMGERFVKGSWNLENYLKNPVVLLSHNNQAFPIGKCIGIAEDESGLLAKSVFHDTTEEAKTAFELMANGFLNAFSVGFIPKNYVAEPLPDGKGKGIAFTEAELYEYSVVSVPANPGCVVGPDVQKMVCKLFGEDALKKIGEDQYLVPPDMRESVAEHPEDLTAALKNLHLIARMVRGKPLDESKLSLVKSTMDVLHEAICEANGGVSPDDFGRLGTAVRQFAECLSNAKPDHSQIIKATISQVVKALASRAA